MACHLPLRVSHRLTRAGACLRARSMAEAALDAETEALESFFQGADAEIAVSKSRADDGAGGGDFSEAALELSLGLGGVPSPCTIVWGPQQDRAAEMTQDAATREVHAATRTVEHLAPIHLRALISSDYPDVAPTFSLECVWLSLRQQSQLCRQLDAIAQENSGGSILFQWALFLHDQAAEHLGLGDTLVLNPLDGLTGPGSDALDLRAHAPCTSAEEVLAHLERADHGRRRRAFVARHHSCGICFDEVAGVRAVELGACQHVFCRDCLQALCQVQISEGAVQLVRCPEVGCGETLLPSDIAPLVSPDLFERYEAFTLKRALEAMDDLAWCPRCEGAVIREQEDALARCCNCGYNFCALCRSSWHTGACVKTDAATLERCRDSIAQLRGVAHKSKRDVDQLRRLESLLATLESEDAIRKSGAKACPRCSTTISKAGGCDKTSYCTRCICLLGTARENRSDGLNMLAVHSALWLAFCGLDSHGRCAGATK